MYCIITCNGYTVEGTAATLLGAIAECARRETASGDGYARVVSHDGKLVADADGPFPPEEKYVDHATMTGMYDRH